MHHPLSVILMDVQSLLHRAWKYNVQHALCEANACAYYSAQQGACQNVPIKIMQKPPMAMSNHLLTNKSFRL